MARQVLPWVGAAVGSIWGQPQLGFAIGSLIGNAVDPQVIKGPALGEGQNNTASEGGYRPIVLGKGAVGVCMIHQGPEIIRTIRTRQSKGGGPVTEEQRRYRTMAFALGESAYPDTGVQLLRMWFDNKLVYDVTPTSQIVAESAEFAERFTFYPGNETQEPDPDLEAMPVENGGGAGNVPSYRGGCPYIVLPEYDVTDSGGRAPMIKAELASASVSVDPSSFLVVGRRSGNPWWLRSADGEDWPVSTSPIDVLLAPSGGLVATNDRWVNFETPFATIVTLDRDADSWNAAAGDGIGSTAGGRRGWFDGETIAIASPNGIAVSTNNGDSFSRDSGGVVANGMFKVGPTWVAVRRFVNIFRVYTGSSPTGLVEVFGHGLDGGILSVATDAVYAYLVVTKIDSSRAVYRTNSGATFEAVSVGFTGGELPTCVVKAPVGSESLWIIGTDQGRIYASNGASAWEQIGDFGGPMQGIAFNGAFFVGIGRENDDGNIKSSADLATWTLRRVIDFSPGDSYFGGLSALPYGEAEHAAEKVPLHTIATWIHGRLNVPAGKYNVSELTDLVEGVVFSDGYTGASAMQALMPLYFFGAGEYDAGSGYKLNYVKHGKPAAMTLTEDDIVEGPEDWEREDSYERPRVLHVQYPNPIADYGAPNIVIKRTSPDVLVVGERSSSVPVVFSDVDEITRRADVMMTVIYTEIAGTYKLVLPWSLLTLAPTDTIGFSIRGRTRRLRMDQWRFSPDGTISTEFLADRQSAWTSNVTGLPAVPSKPPPPSIVGPTASAVLDIPALADNLDMLHLIVAASGQSPAWYGSDHQRKLPSDADYSTMLRFSGVTTIMGALQADVTAASPHFTDTTNIVRVQLYRDDELLTYTQEQFLSENGAFALAWDDSGVRRWEVCQYRDAVKVGDAEWELTTLQRGRLNTDAEAHPAGSLFVLLDDGIRAMPMQSPMLGQDVTHRAVSLGQLPDQSVPYTEEYTGESQREWPVTDLNAGLNGDDLEIAWIPRHRFGTDDAPIPSQNWRGYRVSATDGVNTATVETTVEGHTFDVTGWSTPITVAVSQLNRITGEGPVVTKEVP